jgi:hypothetical protein
MLAAGAASLLAALLLVAVARGSRRVLRAA